MRGFLVSALTLQKNDFPIGIGMRLVLMMAFNVRFIIWPNQKVMERVEASAEDKAKAERVAMLMSRTNTVLSLPKLYCMAAQSFGGFG